MQKKKILIISMTGGFGHIRAGEALLDYAKENLPNIHAEHFDVADMSPLLKKFTLTFYDFTSKKFPFIWGILYRLVDIKLFSFIIKKIGSSNIFLNRKIKNYIHQKNPDGIIFTNVLSLPLFFSTCRKMNPSVKMGVVVTDYHGHSYYHFSFLDYYFVANLHVRKDLENVGIEKEKIIETGIPINPRFYVKENIGDLKLKYGIKNDLPVVVFIASFRISKNNLVLVIKQLMALKDRINLIAIANGNEEFYTIIKDTFLNAERFLLVNWTNVIEEYIKISDVVISKAGGLTVSECLSLQKTLIMINPIPGQEEHNALFVQKNNLGKKIKNINELITVLPSMILSAKNKKVSSTDPKNPGEKIFHYFLI